MAVYWVKSTDVGAPTLSGTNGAGIAVYDFILNTTAGLTILYTGTNRAIYQMPNGDVLRCYHDSAASGNARFMIVRAAESASAIDSIVDPFPTVAQIADSGCNVMLSNTADSTARAWWALVDTDPATGCFYFFCDPNSAQIASGSLYWGGSLISALPVDSYSAGFFSRNSTSTAASSYGCAQWPGTLSASSGLVWLKRSRDGVIKSTRCTGSAPAGAAFFGGVNNAPPYPDPDDGKLRLAKISTTDWYSQSTTPGASSEVIRMWVPRLFQPLHPTGSYASIALGDEFADSSYDASAQFAFFKFASNAGSQGALAVQIAGPWAVPSG